jgi:hypothetical protein
MDYILLLLDNFKQIYYEFFIFIFFFSKLSLSNITQEYRDAIEPYDIKNLIRPNWEENPQQIQKMIAEVEKFDLIRNQDWRKTFPEVAEFYSRYI